VAGCEGAFSIGSAKSAEYDHFAEIDEREARRTHDNVVHQQCDAVGVVNHRHTSAEDAGAYGDALAASGGAIDAETCADYKSFPARRQGEQNGFNGRGA
jgi:hypothetical protein